MIHPLIRRGSLSFLCALVLAAPVVAQAKTSELKELQPRIDAAIDKGVEWLLKHQLRDGSWGHHQENYPNGMTSLALYTLVKSGITPEHPAVVRALSYLSRRSPKKTYSAALQLMAYESLKDAKLKPAMKDILKDLLAWQDGSGGWGYPESRVDMSNTQYGALGLRAAHLAGLAIPPTALNKLVECALGHQTRERPVKLEAAPESGDGYTRTPGTRTAYAAGGIYERNSKFATGSMTTANIGILQIARDCLGRRLQVGQKRDIDRQIDFGVNWLEQHWSLAKNPTDEGPDKAHGWHYYYLYGLERVGSLLGRELLGCHPWYLEGAKLLVEAQKKDGLWNDEPDTCFALLFLRRATWAGGTTGVAQKKKDVFEALGKELDVRMKGSGNPDLTLWVDGFGSHVLEKHKDLRVQRVEYMEGERVIAAVEGQIARPWNGETFAIRHRVTERGKHVFKAKVYLLGETTSTAGPVLSCPGFTVEADAVLEPWMQSLMDAAEKNFLSRIPFQVDVSSEQERNPGQKAVDGLESTDWAARADEETPTLIIKLARAQRCEHITVSPHTSSARLIEVELRINRVPKTLRFPMDGVSPVCITLPSPTKIQRLELTLKRIPNAKRAVRVAEVYLH